MSSKELAELTGRGYTPYVVMKGEKSMVKLSDNRDIVTDKEDNGMEVVPKGGKNPIKFMQRGRNNNMPYDVMKRIGTNVTVGSNVEFKTKVIYGDGILVYRMSRDEQGNIQKKEVLPSEEPEIFEFLRMNNYNHIRMEIANDLAIFYDSYIEYIFNREDRPKIVQIKSKEATCSRISEIDEKTGKSEWHGYSAEWHKGTPTDLIATPLLDRQTPLRDLMTRMGLLPNDEGKKLTGNQRRFIHNIQMNTPGRFYYGRPYWWSIFASGWYDFSSAIPVLKKSLIKNQMSLRYVVYIKDTFWSELYKNHKAIKEDEQVKLREQFLKEMNDYLTGEENAGKTFVSHFRYDRVKGTEDKDIIITPLQSSQDGGEYIEDSEETSNTLSYGMGVHPSIIGSSPGKNKSINGTEARELFIITQALNKTFQEATLEPLYVVKEINGWPKDIYFSVTNCQLTTLDKGTGAVKNTGIKPETEE